MTVSSWTISGGGNSRNVAAQEAFSFAIGGTLTVNANQAEAPIKARSTSRSNILNAPLADLQAPTTPAIQRRAH